MKHVFILLLSFISSLPRDQLKCLFLNDEPFMVRFTVFYMNPVELKYYPFMISLNKCTGSGNVLSPKICVLKETKVKNFKAFYMITNKMEAKTSTKHISRDCKYKFNSTTCNLDKQEKMKHFKVVLKIIVHAKKIIVENLKHVF